MRDVALSNQEKRYMGDLSTRLLMVGGFFAVAGIGASILVGFAENDGKIFWRSYLVGFVFAMSIVLGSLFFVLIQHLTKAGWSVTIRRIAEGFAASAWVLAVVFFIGLAVLLLSGNGELIWKWMNPELFSENERHVLEGKEKFLNTGFFILRNAVYFGIWSFLGWFFYKNSVEQDRTGDPQLTTKMQAVAAPGMLLFALTLTFAAFDWVMSLEALWFSTMFGVYFFAVSVTGFFSLLIIVVYLLQRSGRMTSSVTIEHYQDMGKQLFAFGIVFWAYIAYSQYMLIWYANMPEETTWFMTRQLGGWLPVTMFLLVGHFVGPFLLFVSKHPKRKPGMIASLAGWMLFISLVDVFWLIKPEIPSEAIHAANNYQELALALEGEGGFSLHLLDLTWVVAMLGVLITAAGWRLRSCSLVPERDPRLNEALAFENT